MNNQVKKLLTIGAFLGFGYFAFQHLFKEKKQNVQILSLEKTRRIAQEIKHQVLIVCVKFTDGIQEQFKNIKKTQDKQVLNEHFTQKIAQIYRKKQQIILIKFNVSKLQYQQSLIKHSGDAVLEKTKNDIIQALRCSVQGRYPNFDVDPKAAKAYGQIQLEKIYIQLCVKVLTALVEKLREEKRKNPSFNSNDNEQFTKSVRELDVYNKKQVILKNLGFKPEWGPANEVFLKLMESQNLRDPQFKLRMKNLQQIYDQAVQNIAADPIAYKIQGISNLFAHKKKAEEGGKVLSKSMIDPKAEDEEFSINKSSHSEYKQKQNQDDVPEEAKDL